MRLIVGLGNPGDAYTYTRHNLGFLVVNYIHDRYDLSFSPWSHKKKFNGELSEGEVSAVKTLLLKPETYINNSGVSVLGVLNYYALALEEILVIHDDMDLPFGDFSLHVGKGAAGHHGVESIIKHQHGDKYFARLRIGIGHPVPAESGESYVLGKFSDSEGKLLPDIIRNASQEALVWIGK